MKTPQQRMDRCMENQLVANLATMDEATAQGQRNALVTAAIRDLIWRTDRRTAAEFLYSAADRFAVADLATERAVLLPSTEPVQENRSKPAKAMPKWLDAMGSAGWFMSGLGTAFLISAIIVGGRACL